MATCPVAEEIIGITDKVCAKLLDAEYVSLARQVVAKLARKRPSPLLGGHRVTWAAAVLHAWGRSSRSTCRRWRSGAATSPTSRPSA